MPRRSIHRSIIVLALVLAATQAAHLRELFGPESPQRKLVSTCNIESGVDYVGNDINSISNRPLTACCDECVAVQGCNAFSWNDFNGGTCWLKSGKGSITDNAKVWSGVVVGSPADCPIEYGQNYVGNDIGNAYGADPKQCCSVCHEWTGCRFFSWSNHNGGTCWLKNAKGQVAPNFYVASGQVSSNP